AVAGVHADVLDPVHLVGTGEIEVELDVLPFEDLGIEGRLPTPVLDHAHVPLDGVAAADARRKRNAQQVVFVLARIPAELARNAVVQSREVEAELELRALLRTDVGVPAASRGERRSAPRSGEGVEGVHARERARLTACLTPRAAHAERVQGRDVP